MKKIFFFFPLLIFLSCSSKKSDISQFGWLSGKWVGTVKGEIFYEEWSEPQGMIMTGHGYEVKGNDTVFSENIKIEQRGTDFFYIPDVKENNGPVDFKFTGASNDSLIFENPQHDFPQRIVYFHTSGHQMYACIDGKNKGQYMRVEFPFERKIERKK